MEELLTPYKKNHFFGYYDKLPINNGGNYLLSHESEKAGSEISKSEKVNICITNLKTKETNIIDSSLAWNYQQGSQLQWLNNDSIIFNSFDGENYTSIIININKTKCKRKLKYPVYSLSDDKKIYSSVNYSRLNKFRHGYGYIQKDFNVEDDDLMQIRDLNIDKPIIILKKENFKVFTDIKFSNCWIDHIIFAPQSYDFVFLLRFTNNNSNLTSYLFYFDFKTKEVFNILNSGMAGHGAWKDKNNFIIWGRENQFTKKLGKVNNLIFRKIFNIVRKISVPDFIRKNIYRDCYINFNKENKNKNILNLKIPMKISGGHFNFIKNTMISDTYHDHENLSTLFKYDLDNKILKKFSKLRCIDTIKDKPYRCDLHPRIISENEIIVDSTHEGFRGIYKIFFQ